jgi:hypothetical protein
MIIMHGGTSRQRRQIYFASFVSGDLSIGGEQSGIHTFAQDTARGTNRQFHASFSSDCATRRVRTVAVPPMSNSR